MSRTRVSNAPDGWRYDEEATGRKHHAKGAVSDWLIAPTDVKAQKRKADNAEAAKRYRERRKHA